MTTNKNGLEELPILLVGNAKTVRHFARSAPIKGDVKMKWQSNASYGKPVEDGTIFMNENKGFQVHRIIHCPGWYLTCADLGFLHEQLNGDEFDDAVSDAKRLIQQRLDVINHKYGFFINDNSKNEIVRYL